MDGQIQPQMFPDHGPGIVIGNKSLMTDHDVDGIPWDEAQAEEHQDRDYKQGGDDQEESSEDISLHVVFSFELTQKKELDGSIQLLGVDRALRRVYSSGSRPLICFFMSVSIQ